MTNARRYARRMPKTLGIPQPLHRPLKTLFEMPAETRPAILTALSNAGAKSSPEDLVPIVAAASDISVSDAQRMVTALVSMYGAREALHVSIDEFVEKVVAAAQRFAEPERPAVADWPAASEFLKQALSLHATVGITAKSLILRTSQNNTFLSSQIITDLRPIYAPDPSAPPMGAIILHTLRITRRDSEKNADVVYAVMDTDDLRLLRDDIDRAFKKEASIRSFFARDGFPVLTIDGEEET